MKTLTAVVSASATRLSITYRRLVLKLTVPDNALSSLSISLYDTNFEEMTLLPWFVENEWVEILLNPIGHKFNSDLNTGFDDTKLKIA